MHRHLIAVGAGPGIGQATAERFGREGYRLSLLSRTPQPQARALEALGLRARAYPADAAHPGDLRGALEQALREQGPATVLLYNAAATSPGGSFARPIPEFAQALSLSVTGALVAAQAVVPGMLEAGNGSLLLTGGGLALAPNAAHGTLAVGKAALRALALTLAQELEPQGVHVATLTVAARVAPGSETARRVAEQFWALHQQPKGAWEAERVYRDA